jgi:hypothetical protein
MNVTLPPRGTLEYTRLVMHCFFGALEDTNHKPQDVREVLREFGFAPLEVNAVEMAAQSLGAMASPSRSRFWRDGGVRGSKMALLGDASATLRKVARIIAEDTRAASRHVLFGGCAGYLSGHGAMSATSAVASPLVAGPCEPTMAWSVARG